MDESSPDMAIPRNISSLHQLFIEVSIVQLGNYKLYPFNILLIYLDE